MTRRPKRELVAALVLTTALVASFAPAASAEDLVGTFGLTAGKSKVVKKKGKRTVKVTGTYFRMLLSGRKGTKARDFFRNSNSRSKDKTYTLMRPGIDGGLVTGGYQPMPDPPFDFTPPRGTGNGSSYANRIMLPEKFAGIRFGLSTDPVDQQAQVPVSAPLIRRRGRKLTADLRAFTASWNEQFFNQGSPKPSGKRPGGTRSAKGTYNAKTRRYELTWKSQIIGGPFHGFIGIWHLQGKFRPAS